MISAGTSEVLSIVSRGQSTLTSAVSRAAGLWKSFTSHEAWHRYRIGEVPPIAWPVYVPYTAVVAGLLAGCSTALLTTATIECTGMEHCAARPQIFAIWHENSLPFITLLPRAGRHAWIMHPYWYVKPVQLWMKWLGFEEIILGSSGNGGREAMGRLVEALRQGASTGLTPDGPTPGPAHQLKKGLFHIARETGAEVVPVALDVDRKVRLPSWDRKVIPLPFANVRIRFGAPIQAGSLDYPSFAEKLTRDLDFFRVEAA